eukprot:COSAG05_NODE_174_length_14944_cov_32.054092_10_plen_387_part_00
MTDSAIAGELFKYQSKGRKKGSWVKRSVQVTSSKISWTKGNSGTETVPFTEIEGDICDGTSALFAEATGDEAFDSIYGLNCYNVFGFKTSHKGGKVYIFKFVHLEGANLFELEDADGNENPDTVSDSWAVIQRHADWYDLLQNNLDFCTRKEIAFPGNIVDDPELAEGGNSIITAASFPGRYGNEWAEITTESAGDYSTACVFLVKANGKAGGYGAHAINPETGKCWCQSIYPQSTRDFMASKTETGESMDWGCQWFEEWKVLVHKAVDLGHWFSVFYFRGHLAKTLNKKNGTSIETTEWNGCGDDVFMYNFPETQSVPGEVEWDQLTDAAALKAAGTGLGGSQKAEVAYLKKIGAKFQRVDVGCLINHTNIRPLDGDPATGGWDP